jgi:glycosyltransferase involved in cell wall biosynthesis/GT2 family glycosyltransferase
MVGSPGALIGSVTVVVATYRRPERLAACLDGLHFQTRPAEEVLVVLHRTDEPTARLVRTLARSWPQLRFVQVDRHGSVAAYGAGLAAAHGEIVAYIDDDAVSAVDWLERLVETFERDKRIAAVGGRDIIDNGSVPGGGGDAHQPTNAPTVGRIQWWGRMLGNHHIGAGNARDVDVLKGANMSFRRAAVVGHGFDERLLGEGAQVHSEMSICLPLRQRGLRVVYDPAIVVNHFPASRPHGDRRGDVAYRAVFASAHNEALQILDHFGPTRRVVFAVWGLLVGTSESPGLAVATRDAMARKPAAWSRFRGSQRGRAAAWKTRRTPRASEPGAPSSDGADTVSILRVADVAGSATAGMSGYMLSSAQEMERLGHRVSFWFRDQLAPAMTHSGMRRLLLPWVIAAKVIDAIHRGERFDVVEVNAASSGTYGLIARLLGTRLPASVVLSHGLDERRWDAELAHLRVYGRRPPLRSRILVPLTLLSQARLACRTAEAVLVVSSADRDYLIDRMDVRPDRVSCVFAGVSRRLFEVTRTPRRDARLLFLGGWLERKGTLELVAAWRRLAADREGVRLTIAGVGDSAQARADTKGLARVDLIEKVRRDELPGLLADHDLFVLPSWFEGMPLSMLEAAAAGLACVVCAICGNLDMFRPDDPRRDGAILIPPNDSDALYHALATLVDDGDLRFVLGTRARERAREFTWARNAERTLSAYAATLDRRVQR